MSRGLTSICNTCLTSNSFRTLILHRSEYPDLPRGNVKTGKGEGDGERERERENKERTEEREKMERR